MSHELKGPPSLALVLRHLIHRATPKNDPNERPPDDSRSSLLGEELPFLTIVGPCRVVLTFRRDPKTDLTGRSCALF
jgi:hypothetical protein